MNRRSFLTGVGLVAAPAIIRPGILMPVRTWHDGICGEIRWALWANGPWPWPDYPMLPVISDGRRWLPAIGTALGGGGFLQ